MADSAAHSHADTVFKFGMRLIQVAIKYRESDPDKAADSAKDFFQLLEDSKTDLALACVPESDKPFVLFWEVCLSLQKVQTAVLGWGDSMFRVDENVRRLVAVGRLLKATRQRLIAAIREQKALPPMKARRIPCGFPRVNFEVPAACIQVKIMQFAAPVSGVECYWIRFKNPLVDGGRSKPSRSSSRGM